MHLLVSKRAIVAFCIAMLATSIVLLNQRQQVALYPTFVLELLAIVILAPTFLSRNKLGFNTGTILFLVLCLAILSNVTDFVRQASNPLESWLKLLLPVLLVPMVTRVAARRPASIEIFKVIFLLALFFAFFKAQELSQISVEKYGFERQTNWANVIGAISPFVFLIRREWLRYVFLALIAIFLLFALKRSGLAVLLILVLIQFWDQISSAFKTRRQLLSGLFVAGSIGVGLYLIAIYNVFNIVQYFSRAEARTMAAGEDRGSGRLDIWTILLDSVSSSDFSRIFLGFGFGSSEDVLLLQGLHYESAHNDFIEFFVSFGLLGAIVYTIFILRVTYVSVWVSRRFPVYAKFAVANLLVFAVYSLVAGTFFYYYFFVPLFVGIGFLEAIRRNASR